MRVYLSTSIVSSPGKIQMPSSPPKLSVIIVSWNTCQLLERCLAALVRETQEKETEILVIDNASTDNSIAMVKDSFPTIQLTCNTGNEGYAAGVNRGIDQATGSLVLLLGSDTVVHEGSIRGLVRKLGSLDPSHAAVAPQLRNEDGSIQASCRSLPTPWTILLDMTRLWRLFPTSRILGHYRLTDWNHDDERDVLQPQMTCLLVRQKAFEEVGKLDADSYPLYFNDVDWCTRLHRRGRKILFFPESKVTHGYGKSTELLGNRRRTVWRTGFMQYMASWHSGVWYLPHRILFYFTTWLWVLAGRTKEPDNRQ